MLIYILPPLLLSFWYRITIAWRIKDWTVVWCAFRWCTCYNISHNKMFEILILIKIVFTKSSEIFFQMTDEYHEGKIFAGLWDLTDPKSKQFLVGWLSLLNEHFGDFCLSLKKMWFEQKLLKFKTLLTTINMFINFFVIILQHKIKINKCNKKSKFQMLLKRLNSNH